MKKKRRQYSAEFKARVARAALRDEKTIAELSSKYEVHSSLIAKWKKQLVDASPDVFSRKHKTESSDSEDHEAQLYQQIGKLQVELAWLKKKGRELGLDCY